GPVVCTDPAGRNIVLLMCLGSYRGSRLPKSGPLEFLVVELRPSNANAAAGMGVYAGPGVRVSWPRSLVEAGSGGSPYHYPSLQFNGSDATVSLVMALGRAFSPLVCQSHHAQLGDTLRPMGWMDPCHSDEGQCGKSS